MRIKIHASKPSQGVSIYRDFGTEWGANAWITAMRTLYGSDIDFSITTTL